MDEQNNPGAQDPNTGIPQTPPADPTGMPPAAGDQGEQPVEESPSAPFGGQDVPSAPEGGQETPTAPVEPGSENNDTSGNAPAV